MSAPGHPSGRLSRSHLLGTIRLILADQRLRYLVVGGINTVLSMALFIALDAWLGNRVPSVVPLLIAWTISVACVFFIQRAFVFKVSGHLLRDLSRFVMVNAGALGVNVVLLFIAADLLGAPRVPAQLAITVVTVIFSYLGHKHYSFGRRASAGPPESPDDEIAHD